MDTTKKYQPNPAMVKRLEDDCRYHPVHGDQAERYAANRADVEALGKALLERCPESRELTIAIRRLKEALMYANAAIAINEKPDVENRLPD